MRTCRHADEVGGAAEVEAAADATADGGDRGRPRPAAIAVTLLTRKPLGAAGGIITILFLLIGVFADVLAPYGMNELHTRDMLSPPSATYWLGTDNLGRDILSRVIFGARISMIVGLAASALSTAIGVIIGMLSGYVGGKLDLVLQRVVDGIMSLPLLPVVLVVVSLFGPGMLTLILVMGILWGIGSSRSMRAIIMSFKTNVYVVAAAAVGSRTRRILWRHLLPNVMPFIVTGFTITVPAVILTEAALSFLGFGVPPPAPSWGGMLGRDGRQFMYLAPWMAIWPGLALSIVVYGISMFGDALRDVLDPRLKGGVGRYGMDQGRTRRATPAAGPARPGGSG